MRFSKTSKGVLFVFISIFPSCFISLLVAWNSELTNPQKAFFRFLAGIIFLFIMFVLGKFKLQFKNKPLLLARGIFGCTAIIIMFTSINTLGIGRGTVLYYTFPIFACLTASIMLKEKLTLWKWLAIITAFLGVALLYIKSANDLYSFFYLNRYEFLDLFGAFCGGLTVTIIRQCHKQDTVFSIFCAQSVIGIAMFSFSVTSLKTLNFSPLDIFVICGIGVAAIFSQTIRTLGYRYTPVKNGAVICMLIPVINIVMGICFFHEPLYLNEIVGAATIIISCFVVLREDKPMAIFSILSKAWNYFGVKRLVKP